MPARCWLCDRPVVAPLEVIGRRFAGTVELVHKQCLVRLGELELDFMGPDVPASPGRRNS